MIGLSSRSSSRKPCRGSEAGTGVPRKLGVGEGLGVGGTGRAATAAATSVLTGSSVGTPAKTGVAVGTRVGRGVNKLAGLSEAGVGCGGGAGVHAARPSRSKTGTGSRICREAAEILANAGAPATRNPRLLLRDSPRIAPIAQTFEQLSPGRLAN